jgi:hypothetical protein
MRSGNALLGIGAVLLVVVSSLVLVGSVMEVPFVAIGLALLGTTSLIVGVVRMRDARGRGDGPAASRAERLVRPAFLMLCGLAVAALVVAFAVGEGGARGHAIYHLIAGVVCLGLFAGLGFAWRPAPDTGRATFRTVLLWLLGLSTFGALVESLGGAGYDVANEGRRLETLTVLHDVGLLFGPFLMLAVPLGLGTIIALGAARLARLRRPA